MICIHTEDGVGYYKPSDLVERYDIRQTGETFLVRDRRRLKKDYYVIPVGTIFEEYPMIDFIAYYYDDIMDALRERASNAKE